jgi:hypothetical protein
MTLEKKLTHTFMTQLETYTPDFEKTFMQVKASKAIYKGEPVPYLHIPKLYSEEDVNTFKEALTHMHDLCKRTIDLYLEEASVRDLFAFDQRLDDLIRLPHHYTVPVPMGRFDIFYYEPKRYMFCELNTDGASAMNEELELSKILKETELLKTLSQDYTFESFELFHSWVKEVGHIYAEFATRTGKAPEKPVVAIVDFMEKGSSIEFEVFKSAFESDGYTCIIADARDIKCVEGRMVVGDIAIDLVYRRLVTKDLMDHYDDIPDFIRGIFAGKTCIVGSIKTQIVHTKRFFQVLHEPSFQKYLSEAQIAFINAHVPFTRPLQEADIPTYCQEKADYIIKPVDYYASKGVCAGKDYDDSAWLALLTEKSSEDFIVQKYCPLSLVDNIRKDSKGQFEARVFNTITGLFTYNGQLSGIYVRAGLNAIISGLHEGYTMATLVYREKA